MKVISGIGTDAVAVEILEPVVVLLDRLDQPAHSIGRISIKGVRIEIAVLARQCVNDTPAPVRDWCRQEIHCATCRPWADGNGRWSFQHLDPLETPGGWKVIGCRC